MPTRVRSSRMRRARRQRPGRSDDAADVDRAAVERLQRGDARSTVVLPPPESPISATSSPRSTCER